MADGDLTVFVEACREFRQPISIRGSTAYVLSMNSDSDSILDNVPPFGDLDLIVRDGQPVEAMRRVGDVLERYRTYVPASRFIHVDVFYEHLPVRDDSPLGNVVIDRLPEVAIDVGEQQDVWTAMRPPSDQRVQAQVILKAPATLFRDFLFLLRLRQRYEELDTATREVAELLSSQRPGALGLTTRAVGGVRELARIDKGLVKHVLLRETEGEKRLMTDYLRTDWLHQFAPHLNDLSKMIIVSENHWAQASTIAYMVDGRLIQFSEWIGLDNEEDALLKKKLDPDPEAEPIRQRLTPSLKITLPNPDDPGCCEYRDFSKGISELVFTDRNEGSLLDVALMEGREKYYAVHAQASERFGVRSLRTDPGFMSILNYGTLGAVRLTGVRSQ